MLTQLSTVKSRLALTITDYDDLLTSAIKAVSARFDKECNRTLAPLEQGAVEQVAYWFRNRDTTGLLRSWPHSGTYESFLQSDLLLEVRAVLKKYERWTI